MAVRFGLTGDQLCDPAKARFYEGQGLVWRDGARVGVNGEGMVLLDGLLSELVPEQLVAG
jgi:oxygen-independent coproporphyrinogen-3 oxidase